MSSPPRKRWRRAGAPPAQYNGIPPGVRPQNSEAGPRHRCCLAAAAGVWWRTPQAIRRPMRGSEVSRGRAREFWCEVVSETVLIRLKRNGGFGRAQGYFVQCNQTDCQYVEENK